MKIKTAAYGINKNHNNKQHRNKAIVRLFDRAPRLQDRNLDDIINTFQNVKISAKPKTKTNTKTAKPKTSRPTKMQVDASIEDILCKALNSSKVSISTESRKKACSAVKEAARKYNLNQRKVTGSRVSTRISKKPDTFKPSTKSTRKTDKSKKTEKKHFYY